MPCKYKNVALTVVDIGQGSADQSTRLETYVKKIRTSKSKSNKKS